MAYIHETACREMDLDPEKVLRIAKRLERAGRDAHALGLTVFGHSGAGRLLMEAPRQMQEGHCSHFAIAEILGGHWDGGDPDTLELEPLQRGESK